MTALLQAQAKARRSVARILRYDTDEVDDVLQNAAVKALRSESSWRGESSYDTWFTSIAIREALMFLRRKRAQPERVAAELDAMFAATESPEACAARREREARLYAGIERLSIGMRLVALRILAGDEMHTGADKAARFRMRHKLREVLEQ